MGVCSYIMHQPVLHTIFATAKQVWASKARLHVQANGNVSQLEAQVAGLQQSVLQARDMLHVKLQDAVGARKQAEQQLRVRCVHAPVCLCVCVCGQQQLPSACGVLKL